MISRNCLITVLSLLMTSVLDEKREREKKRSITAKWQEYLKKHYQPCLQIIKYLIILLK